MALAAALIHNPRVLFLDEPLNGIDPVSGRVVTDLLRRLAQKGVTLFFTRTCSTWSSGSATRSRSSTTAASWPRARSTRSARQREVGRDATLEDVFLKLVSADVRREDLSWID